ncbi:MAG: toll/interleukin-1 receptor domain-containing protein [Nitrospirae bacterium]|nr:toll/interleukin-1 receptor domain-containing protein [Nitrospirota bacterium]
MNGEKIRKVFISYSHDSDAHKAWVLKLATDLWHRGVEAILDHWHLRLGRDLNTFMQKGVSDSDRVLMICTETYVKKANEGSVGVGYEGFIINREVAKNIDTDKFIPIFIDNPRLKLPDFIGRPLGVDFAKEEQYLTNLERLVHEIYEIINIPTLGKPPSPVAPPAPSTPGRSRPNGCDAVRSPGSRLYRSGYWHRVSSGKRRVLPDGQCVRS